MYSLLLLLISFIAQIAVAEALAHRHYTRLNHAEKPNIRWMMNNVRHTRHGPIYRSIPDPTPNGQGASAFDSGALGDPTFTSKALVSVVLLAYFVIALNTPSDITGENRTPPGLTPPGFQPVVTLPASTAMKPSPQSSRALLSLSTPRLSHTDPFLFSGLLPSKWASPCSRTTRLIIFKFVNL